MFAIDLSHPVLPTMPVYPGTTPPAFSSLTTIKEHGYRERTLTMASHTGTHMDAPSHILEDGAHLDEMDIARFAGPGLVIDARGRKEIGLADLKPHEKDLEDACFCLLLTGWDLFWGRREYFRNYPTLTAEAAERLCAFSLSGVGVDAISVDPVGDELPVHNILLGSGMVLVENLCNLDMLPATGFTFVAPPLKLVRADGSPVRAMALID